MGKLRSKYLTLEQIEARKNEPRNKYAKKKAKRKGTETIVTPREKAIIKMEEEKTGSKVLVDTEMMLTEKQDLYCYHRALGADRKMAYVRAGYSAANERQECYKLEQLPKILAKIEEYRGHIREQRAMGPDQILGRYELLYNLALEQGDLKTANSVLDKIAMITGVALNERGKPSGFTEIKDAEGLEDLKVSKHPKDDINRLRDLLGKSKPVDV